MHVPPHSHSPLGNSGRNGDAPGENIRGNRVFLTGFMGSGKSTIGPILANTLGWLFVDLDAAVEHSAGRTINEIFKDKGEGFFRELERELLKDLGTAHHRVVALGGGTIANEQNFRMVSQAGILVYLKLSADQLFLRLQRKTNRPLLGGGETGRLDEPLLRTRVAELHRIREPYYNMADVVVETGSKPVGHTVDEVVRKLIPLIS